MVQKIFNKGLSTFHVLIYRRRGGWSGVVSQIWQNMTRADGWQNLTNHGNSEKMWNTNGKVSRAVGAKIFKKKIL